MSPANILVIQFRLNQDSIVAEQTVIKRGIEAFVGLGFLSAIADSLDWTKPEEILSGYQGIIFGGSAELFFDGKKAPEDPHRRTSYELLEKLGPLLEHIFTHDIPTLGICYGHQMLGAYAGASVHCDESQGKLCSHEVSLLVDTKDYFPFSTVPERFYAHYGHKDSLDRVPEGAVLLASGGDQCKVSALCYKNNIYTTQFHPELTFADVVEKIKSTPEYLPEGAIMEKIFIEDPHANTILQNFGKLVALRSKEKDS